MTRFYILLFVAFLGLLRQAQAQSNATPAPTSSCGFDRNLAEEFRQHPELKKQLDANEAQIQRYIARQRQSRTAATVYTIPVVVHVIHNGEAIGTANNPSDAQIQGAIAGLNSFWRKSLSTSGGADIELNFALATHAPCGATTGINRVDGSRVLNYTSSGIVGGSSNELRVKNLSRWSNQNYVNVWVVNKIGGFAAGTVGYATFPGLSSLSDGIVLLASVMTQTDRTLAHEMGHYFNLYHTFEGSNGSTCPPTETDCSTEGDRVCDTERHLAGECVTIPTLNACTGANYLIADASKNYTVRNNYMNYASESCLQMFTEGQKTRIRATLDGVRASLKNGYGFSSNSAGSLVAACMPTFTNPPGDNNNQNTTPSFGLAALTMNGISGMQTGSSGLDGQSYADRSCEYLATVTAGASVTFTVRTTNYASYVKLYLDKDNTGSLTEVASLQTTGSTTVAGSFALPTGTLLGKPLRLRVATTGVAYGAASIVTACGLNEPVSANGSGQIEDFTLTVTGPLPVSLQYFSGRMTESGALLGWQTAREDNNATFQIERSRDAVSFESIATIPSQAADGNSLTELTYTYLDAQPLPGVNYYRLMQTDRDGTRTQAGNIIALNREGVLPVLFPNPVSASGEASVEPALAYQRYQISDVLGRIVQRADAPGLLSRVSLAGLPAGVYLVQVQTDAGPKTWRVLR